MVFCVHAVRHLCGRVEQAALDWWSLPCWQGLVADLTTCSHLGGSCFLAGKYLVKEFLPKKHLLERHFWLRGGAEGRCQHLQCLCSMNLPA